MTEMTEYTYDLQKLFLEMMVNDAQSFIRVQNIFNADNFDDNLKRHEKIQNMMHKINQELLKLEKELYLTPQSRINRINKVKTVKDEKKKDKNSNLRLFGDL